MQGCTPLQSLAKDALLGTEKGIDVDANAGQAKVEGEDGVAQQANTAVSVASKKETVQTYSSPVETVVNEAGLEWWEFAIVILLAGWAIPSPSEMVKGFVGLFKKVH